MSTQTIKIFNHRRRSIATLIIAILIALIASASPQLIHAQSGWNPVNGMVTIINNNPGDQVRPTISGNLVTYSNIVGGIAEVHYYNFLDNTDMTVPQVVTSLDFLSALDGTRIVYTHVTSNSFAINMFDTSVGGLPSTLDPQPASQREKPAIGGQTVAWVDFGLNESLFLSEIVVHDLASGVTTRLTDDQFYDTDPKVSPDGTLIVWTKCQVYYSSCHVWQASFNGSGWDLMPLSGTGEQTNPTTDGQYIVYSSYLDNTTSDSNIFWQTRDGSAENELVLPGNQRHPVVDSGLVVFESNDAANLTQNWELLIYDLGSGAGYHVADSAETSDIEVAPDGLVRATWFQCNDVTACDVYASTFYLPDTDNQPPVIDQIIAPLDPMVVDSTVVVSADFSDLDFADTHSAEWDWGDGSTAAGQVSELNGSGTVSGSHAYANPGVYVVTLSITDNYDASDTAVFQYIVIYDLVGGFVTGSGWINSPEGAFIADPMLTGKAHFGFVSRYQKGASLPSGKTEFQFKAGNMIFRSTAYDWLVVAGAKAQFKGVGTINGNGNYGFLLSVTDSQINGGGHVDRFRIKIWDLASGTVAYDNQIGTDEIADPLTAIDGGAIVIHQ